MKKKLLGYALSFIASSAFAGELAGYKLLVTSIRTGDTEVFVADPETGDMSNLSRAPKSEDRYPCWSPKGTQVCFMSDRENTTNLWIMNADGTDVRRLNRTPAVCYMPSWQDTPVDERVVFGVASEKHYKLVSPEDVTDADLQNYRGRLDPST